MKKKIIPRLVGALKMKGKLDVYLIDPVTKEIVEERHTKNTVVNEGEKWVAELLANETLAGGSLGTTSGTLGWGFQYVGVGTDASSTTQGMFSLQTAVTGSDAFVTAVNDVATPGNKIVCYGSYTTAQGIGELKEAGIFSKNTNPNNNHATSGDCCMFNRSTFPTISKSDAFELTLQWTITIGTVP